jgi:DNA repair exonuclease SbcCD ATPase subunit
MKGSWSKGFMMEEKPEKVPSGARREHGGVKVTASNVTDATSLPAGRYKFRIEGEAPRSVVLTDIGVMLEARFSGEAGVKLDASREQRIQDVRKKYEDSAQATANERARLQGTIGEYEKRKGELEAEYQAKLGNVSGERKEVEKQIQEAKYRLEETERKIQDLLKKSAHMVVTDGSSVQVAPDVEDKIEELLRSWQSELEDYDNPMPVEWTELAAKLAKMMARVVAQTRDAVRREAP